MNTLPKRSISDGISISLILGLFAIVCFGRVESSLGEDFTGSKQLASELKSLSPQVLSDEQREQAASMISREIGTRIQTANDASSAAWHKIQGLEDWERFRDARLLKLKQSLGSFPHPTRNLNLQVTGTYQGDGFVVDNVVFESRPGCFVTANLYRSKEPGKPMPGIVICHSHHRPKEHGELQDMGMTWARAGCVVLVIDLIGHGERQQHPFRGKDDYEEDYRWWRQDYYFRYDAGIQLHLVGDSLMGWEVWDLMRAVDTLLVRPDVDPQRIILLGAVAGGGDPAAVTAALDPRIAAAVPFNFGGPQPETQRLSPDIEKTFGYAGSGSWESTRNLRLSCRDGFLPWTIVGGIAPRKLIYAHEFGWDQARDPVWKRLTKIYEFYDSSDSLDWAKGHGNVKQPSSEATHCTHIGQAHRKMIHPLFRKWFDVPTTTEDEYSHRLDEALLRCMTPDVTRSLHPKTLVELLRESSAERIKKARERLAGESRKDRREQLRRDWSSVLGSVKPHRRPKVVSAVADSKTLQGAKVERVLLEVETGILIPLVLLIPTKDSDQPVPVAMAVAQSGKRGFLTHRSRDVAALVSNGMAVCLPDLRGTGETRPGDGRGKLSADTALSSSELMLGGTTVGARLRDMRAILLCLRGRDDIDARQLFLWGDSFASTNPTNTDFKVPRRVDGRPHQSEPLGGLLALLGAIFEDDVQAVYVRGGLTDFQSVLESPFVYIPHDTVIPGALTVGDLGEVAAAIAPRPLRLEAMVDGLNRRSPVDQVRKRYQQTIESYGRAGADQQFVVSDHSSAAEWLLQRIPVL